MPAILHVLVSLRVLAFCVLCLFICSCNPDIQESVVSTSRERVQVDVSEAPSTPANQVSLPSLDYAKRLIAAGWSKRAAKAVTELNAEWWAIRAEENPVELELELKLLESLGKYSVLDDFITNHPETAGLLCSLKDP